VPSRATTGEVVGEAVADGAATAFELTGKESVALISEIDVGGVRDGTLIEK